MWRRGVQTVLHSLPGFATFIEHAHHAGDTTDSRLGCQDGVKLCWTLAMVCRIAGGPLNRSHDGIVITAISDAYFWQSQFTR